MTNECAWFNVALRPHKPLGSLGRGAQDGHLNFHTAPELLIKCVTVSDTIAHDAESYSQFHTVTVLRCRVNDRIKLNTLFIYSHFPQTFRKAVLINILRGS